MSHLREYSLGIQTRLSERNSGVDKKAVPQEVPGQRFQEHRTFKGEGGGGERKFKAETKQG